MTTVIQDFSNYIAHYGTPRKSGRYPWGSGGNAYQRSTSFLAEVDRLVAEGLSLADIAKANKISQTELRQLKTIAKAERKAGQAAQAFRLRERGVSHGKIAEIMGLAGESSVRALLADNALDKVKILDSTAEMLRDQIDKKKFLDIGSGEHLYAGVSENNFKTAIKKLETEGYKIHYVPIRQLGTGLNTSTKVMTAPGVPYSEVWANRGNIRVIGDVYSEDGGRSWLGIERPTSFSSKRIAIKYKEDGGDKEDGVIHIRPGVPELSLGGNRYAQVRIAVDDTHFLKGMAVYKDDLPPGVDMVFNTSKSKVGNDKLSVMKPMKTTEPDGKGPIDWDNPFGTSISRQSGVMNMVGSPNKPGAGEEGSWATWAKTLSSQFLSKQSPQLAKQQLAMTRERREREFDEISKLTNPVVRQHLLLKLAESTDSAAVHLKAAEMRGQSNHVILPILSMKPTEVFAPNYNNGDRVALVRFPHGGRFEIPELIVNNRNREARKVIGPQSIDAIGIHPDVAKRLSGADFDGDTVLVIPNNHGAVKSSPPLQGLKNFDPQAAYPGYEGMKVMRNTNVQMGIVSNLINDMTLKGASSEELTRAVRHSMVVIDAEKHKLNYRQSERDNGITQLKERYQNSSRGGASTIISRKKREIEVPERKQGYKIDPKTGARIYTPANNEWVDPKTGQTVRKMSKVKWLDEVKDAHELTSGEPIVMEKIYADHSNSLKDLANRARREAVNTRLVSRSPSARNVYKSEVESLESKLQVAQMNAPRERQAQILANSHVRLRRQANPNMTAPEIKKLETQALAEMRTRVGASKTLVNITSSEWDAIQANAISPSKLMEILRHTDLDQVKEYATPKVDVLMTSAKTARATAMLAQGYTQAEVAQQLGVSVSTLQKSLV